PRSGRRPHLASTSSVYQSLGIVPVGALTPPGGGMALQGAVYRPRDAEHTVLHAVIREHLETFLNQGPRAGARSLALGRDPEAEWGHLRRPPARPCRGLRPARQRGGARGRSRAARAALQIPVTT